MPLWVIIAEAMPASAKYPGYVTGIEAHCLIEGFKFHAQPQTGAYSCFHLKASAQIVLINSIPYKTNRCIANFMMFFSGGLANNFEKIIKKIQF